MAFSLTPITGVLGERRAAHLLRRCTFGPSKTDIETFKDLTISEALDILFAEQDIPNAPIPDPDPEDDPGRPFNTQEFKLWHIHQMKSAGTNIKERLVYFLHTHLPTRETIIRLADMMYAQNQWFRHYAYGSFKECFARICYDNAMLKYLDGATNDEKEINENFAREMFELYTIGKDFDGETSIEGDYGTFTEDDVKEAAKILSGFQIDRENVNPNPAIAIGKLSLIDGVAFRHVGGPKTFSNRFGNTVIEAPVSERDGEYVTEAGVLGTWAVENPNNVQEGELQLLMNMVFNQPITAEFLVKKLYRFFVYPYYMPDANNPNYDTFKSDLEQHIIKPLAQIFSNETSPGAGDAWHFEPMLRALLSSEHFFYLDNSGYIDNPHEDDNSYGALIKSPLELTLGTLNFFEIKAPDQETALSDFYAFYNDLVYNVLDVQGLNFYEPYEVAGYSAYHQFPGYHRNWIAPTFLAYRYNYSKKVIGTIEYTTGKTINNDMLLWVETNVDNPETASNIVIAFERFFLSLEMTTERRNQLINNYLLKNGDNVVITNWTIEWNTYILDASNETLIREALTRLVQRFMQTPEFQLF